jgi:hypothetical protein
MTIFAILFNILSLAAIVAAGTIHIWPGMPKGYDDER